jgi:hypothetical protein
VIVLLTISTTHEPASELGFLLHKHPGRVQSFDESVGRAHVFYPEVSQTRCTAALLLEVDPVGFVRGRKGPSGEGFALGQYVNDRPYAASSMLAMALKDVFRSWPPRRSRWRSGFPRSPAAAGPAGPAGLAGLSGPTCRAACSGRLAGRSTHRPARWIRKSPAGETRRISTSG